MHGQNELITLFLLILIGVYVVGVEQGFVKTGNSSYLFRKIHYQRGNTKSDISVILRCFRQFFIGNTCSILFHSCLQVQDQSKGELKNPWMLGRSH